MLKGLKVVSSSKVYFDQNPLPIRFCFSPCSINFFLFSFNSGLADVDCSIFVWLNPNSSEFTTLKVLDIISTALLIRVGTWVLFLFDIYFSITFPQTSIKFSNTSGLFNIVGKVTKTWSPSGLWKFIWWSSSNLVAK